jgi:hypothetical protein
MNYKLHIFMRYDTNAGECLRVCSSEGDLEGN